MKVLGSEDATTRRERRELLLGLAERAEIARGPDPDLDNAIMAAFFGREERFIGARYEDGLKALDLVWVDPATDKWVSTSAREFTRSIDAAVTLVPDGWFWRVGHGTLHAGWAHLNRVHPDQCDYEDEHSARADTPPLALCAAALRAAATPRELKRG